MEIIKGYPEPGEQLGKLEVFDPESGRLRGNFTYYGTRSVPTGPYRVKIVKPPHTSASAGERIGDIAVIGASFAPGGEIPHAIMASDSSGLSFEDVTLYSANTFGFFERGCTGSRYIRCRVDRRAPEDDPVRRDHPRLRSLNADAFHSKHARNGPLYERCVARFMGDDAIAINGDFHFVAGSDGDVLRILAKFEMNMVAGDEVQIFTFDGQRLDNRRIVGISPAGETTAAEREFLARCGMDERLRSSGLKSAYRVQLDSGVDVAIGGLICSADRIGNGFAIRQCTLGFNRSRGILVKAGRGEIVDNQIEATGMTGILVSPEYWWLEAGLADDLVIARNRIAAGEGMGIALVAVAGDGSLAPAGAFNRIEIRDNLIAGGARPGLLLTSVSELVRAGNSVAPDSGKSLHPWQVGPWGRNGLEPVMLENVQPAKAGGSSTSEPASPEETE